MRTPPLIAHSGRRGSLKSVLDFLEIKHNTSSPDLLREFVEAHNLVEEQVKNKNVSVMERITLASALKKKPDLPRVHTGSRTSARELPSAEEKESTVAKETEKHSETNKKGQCKYEELRKYVMQLVKEKNIVTRLPKDCAEKIPYMQQGNLEMYTDENIDKRLALKEKEELKEGIRKWWVRVRKVKGKDEIEKKTYVSLFMAMYTVLIPGFAGKTLEDAKKTAEEDWKEDSCGRETMDFDLFYSAIFEVADIWCRSAELQEYITFLNDLYNNVFEDDTLPKALRDHVKRPPSAKSTSGEVKQTNQRKKSRRSKTPSPTTPVESPEPQKPSELRKSPESRKSPELKKDTLRKVKSSENVQKGVKKIDNLNKPGSPEKEI